MLLTKLLFKLSETLRHFVNGFVQIPIFIILGIEILLVTTPLLTRNDPLVLVRIFSYRLLTGTTTINVMMWHHLRRRLHSHAIRARIRSVRTVCWGRHPSRNDWMVMMSSVPDRRLHHRRGREHATRPEVAVVVLLSVIPIGSVIGRGRPYFERWRALLNLSVLPRIHHHWRRMVLRLLGLTGIGLFIVRDPRLLGSSRSGCIQQSGRIVRRTGSFQSSTTIWTGAYRRSQRRGSITATVVMVLVVMKAATARGRRVTATAARIAHRRCQVLGFPSIIKIL